MIPDKVRRTIIVALARLGEAYRIKQAEVDDEVLSAGWDRKMGEVCQAQEWLDSQRQGQHQLGPVAPESAVMARLQEIESRYQPLDPGPWQWRQVYEIGHRVHWALESPQSAAKRQVLSHLLVLHHAYPKNSSEPVEDDPYLQFIAHSRDDIEWLCQQLRQRPQPGEEVD